MTAHQFRPGAEFDVNALDQYLRAKLPGFVAPVVVAQFPGGQSNPTYLLTTATQRYVLRRKPPGVLLPSAHAIEREFRVMQALGAHTKVPVAAALLLCEDASVIGTAFYVMQHLDGRVFWDPTLPDIARGERRGVYQAMVETLADLHAAEPAALGLTDFGRADGYVARQIARWSKQYFGDLEAAGRVPALERLIDWLPQNAPTTEPAPAVVHGDYRIDNLMFAPAANRVIAVLDWELSTIGDPHADFAYHLMMYRMHSASIAGLQGRDLVALGLPSEGEYIAWYCQARGIAAVPHLDFYVAFCMFRLAGIFHGIRGRVARGTAVSAQARKYAAEVEGMAELAWQQAEAVRR